MFELEKENNLTGENGILYVIFTDQSGMWRILCVPAQPKSFDTRLGLPPDWRGVRDAELETVSGISGATFVHTAGFIGGNKTREGQTKPNLILSFLTFLLSAGVLKMVEASLKQL